VILVGISVHEDEKNVLLRTLDVRQVRRRALGRWKAPGMEEQQGYPIIPRG
jgi:hypothetical protein